MAIGFPELDGTGSGGGTDSAMFNIAKQDDCSLPQLKFRKIWCIEFVYMKWFDVD
jgi:hypothetical protein